MGSVVLPIYRCGLVLYSTGFGVNSVHVVLSGLSMSLLYFVHVWNCCRFGCMFALAAILLMCVDATVMPYTYEVSCSASGGGGGGMSCEYMLKSVGEDSMPP